MGERVGERLLPLTAEQRVRGEAMLRGEWLVERMCCIKCGKPAWCHETTVIHDDRMSSAVWQEVFVAECEEEGCRFIAMKGEPRHVGNLFIGGRERGLPITIVSTREEMYTIKMLPQVLTPIQRAKLEKALSRK